MPTLPAWKADGTGSTGTATVNVNWPSGHATGDFGLLIVNSSNQAVSTPSGWTAMPTGNGTGTGTAASANSTALHVFYRFATSGAESAAALADSGDHTMGVITTFTGVHTGTPIETVAVSTKDTTSTTDTFPEITTVGANRLVVAIVSTGQESVKSDWTFAGLGSFTARGSMVGTSGLDGGVACASGSKATAGATGTGSVTESISSLGASATIALRPADDAISGSLSATLEAATLSAAGNLPIVGSMAVTLGTATLAATGGFAAPITGSLSATLGAATLSAAGALPIVGALVVTLGSLALSSTGTIGGGGGAPVTVVNSGWRERHWQGGGRGRGIWRR